MAIKDSFSTPIVRQTNVAGKTTTTLSDRASIQEKWNSLRNIRNNIQDKNGSIKSGYVSVMTNGNQTLLGRDNSIFANRSRKEAGPIIAQMLKDVVGDKMLDSAPLNKAIDDYFVASKGQFGTQSFAKIFDRLEAMIDPKFRDTTYSASRLNVSVPIQLKVPAQIGETSKQQLLELMRHIDNPTAIFFRRLFDPPAIKAASITKPDGVEAPQSAAAVAEKTVTIGDADGSIGRVMTAAISNGQMKLDREGFKLLGEVLVGENRNQNTLSKYQSDAAIADKIEQILSRATFSKGDNKLVFIGDILHDRFSNNKMAMKTLIETLHGQGVVFIKGNHDVYDEVNPDDNLQNIRSRKQADADFAEQNGFFSAKGLSKQQSDELVAQCFVNAYFDEANGVLYTHNGVEAGKVEGTYETGLGTIKANNPKELADKLNETAYVLETSVFTDFRPADDAMQAEAIGSIGKWNDRKVIFVHGHNDNAGALGNVVNVNARKNGDFCPAAVELS